METTDRTPSKGSAWGMLLLAGLFEIGYALSVGGSQAFTIPGWSIAAAIFFLLTLYFLSAALRTIDVGIGYRSGPGSARSGRPCSGASCSISP